MFFSQKTLKQNKWKYFKICNKSSRVEATLPPDVSNSIARMDPDQKINKHVLFFWKMNNTKILGTYLKNTLKKPFGSKPPSRLLFGFVFMMRYHCILFFFQAKTNTGKYRKKRKNTTETFVRLETTLPAWFVVPIHGLLSLHVILVQATNSSGK